MHKQHANTKILQISDARERNRLMKLALDDGISHEDFLALVEKAGVKWSLRGVCEYRQRAKARQQAEDCVGFYGELQDVLDSAGVRFDRAVVGAALMKLSAWLKGRNDFAPDMLPALLFLQRVTEARDRVEMHADDVKDRRETKLEAGLKQIEAEVGQNAAVKAALDSIRAAITEKAAA